MHPFSRILLGLLACGSAVDGADAPLDVREPAHAYPAPARHPERTRWSWNQAMATVSPTGDLTWSPLPFAYVSGPTVRYIDFDAGSDSNAGTSQHAAWKHHPWDANASGQAAAASGSITYVFKRGVIYRGCLLAKESGTEEAPIRLTSDPAWGQGDAEIVGSEVPTGWTRGAQRPDIPDADAVFSVALDFKPRCVWLRDGATITRVELARIPKWKVSDPDDVKSEWWRLQQPNWWDNGCTKYKVTFGGHPSWLGVDSAHLTEPASSYVGAIAHMEYGWVMSTPFPTRVEGFDPVTKGFYFQGIWTGASENETAGMHYFLEDKPNFLTSAGEFWFDEVAKRLYLRLPGDQDPTHATVEVARHINLIESRGMSHVVISGLRFRFTNQTWDLTQPPWADPDINNACIRVRGPAEDLLIRNCIFDHCAKAVRIDAKAYAPEQRAAGTLDRIALTDNDIDQTDHGAIEIDAPGVGDVKVLRNHLHLIGLRTFRQDHSHALWVEACETMEVAGNILERTTGSGIYCIGGREEMREVPLSRNLVHHNKATDTLLSACDWGGIETNGGPYFNYDNISGNPNGTWNGYDVSKPGSARLGMAFYWDHGYAVTGFNLIAYGRSDAWSSPLPSQAGLYEAAATIENALFNSTIYRFWTGSQWSPAGGRHLFLGNIFDDIGGLVFQHSKLKEDTVAGNGAYPHETMAYGRNVFSRVPSAVIKATDGTIVNAFSVYELTTVGYANPQAMAASLVGHHPLVGDVGILAADSPLRDPATLDFRPKPSGAAIGHGVKVFVPWTLARTVGQWHFRHDHADATILYDDHFHLTAYYSSENPYAAPLFPLKAHHITDASYIAGPLEDWTEGALRLDGVDQFASISQADMTKAYTYDAGNNQQHTVQGKDILSPDIDTGNLLIEAYFQAMSGRPACVLVSKHAASGYQLALNRAGGVTFSIYTPGAKAEIASGAIVNDGRWHHVLVELDRHAGNATIYTDGVASTSAPMAVPAGVSLSNDADLLVGRGPQGDYFTGAIEFLRIARATLAEGKTSIAELYDWEFDGPFLRDFAGHDITGRRDAGALQSMAP